MKRARTEDKLDIDIDGIDKEIAQLQQKIKELDKKKSELKIQRVLEKQLPSGALQDILDDFADAKTSLVRLYIDQEFPDDDDDSSADEDAWTWVCHITTNNSTTDKTQIIEVDRYHLGGANCEFQELEFYNNPVKLWHVAMFQNDEQPIKALAAFCHACCEKTGDYTNDPIKAFDKK